MDPEDARIASDTILENLAETEWWKQAEVVLTFLSMKEEVSTRKMIRSSQKAGKQVGVPRLSGKSMEFYPLSPNENSFIINSYGIEEPAPDRDPFQFARMGPKRVLIIVPGLAFDLKKHRLGRGGGYYDRFMRRLRETPALLPVFVGIFFQRQMLKDIPLDPWDETLDAVVTESDVIR